MPELPEVECLRRSLMPHLMGRKVVTVRLYRRDVVVTPDDPPGGASRRAKGKGPPSPVRRLRAEELLSGTTITDLRRHGKQLAILGKWADGRPMRVLLVHLGMTGQLRYLDPGVRLADSSHIHAKWRLDPPGRLVFRDPRRFGGLWTLPTEAALEARWQRLGPDALRVTAPPLRRALEGSRRAVKAALLDQAVIAGVGNIYADEALFLSCIHPGREAGGLTSAEYQTLTAAIRQVLRWSIASGGSTLRDYVDGQGRRGRGQERHMVYGRGGEPCRECGSPLCSGVIGQRTTTWCRVCQPRGRRVNTGVIHNARGP